MSMSESNEHGHPLEYIDGEGDLMVLDPNSNPLFPSYLPAKPKKAKKPAKKSKKAKKA